jgi:hypothetical protein
MHLYVNFMKHLNPCIGGMLARDKDLYRERYSGCLAKRVAGHPEDVNAIRYRQIFVN